MAAEEEVPPMAFRVEEVPEKGRQYPRIVWEGEVDRELLDLEPEKPGPDPVVMNAARGEIAHLLA